MKQNTQKQNKNIFKNIFTMLVFVLFLLVSSNVNAGTITKPANNLGLVGYWSLNDGAGTSALDFSGNGNTGTLTNMSAPATATSGWGNGKLGGGLNFDGVNDYVDLGSMNSVNGVTQLTISGWVKRGSLTTKGMFFSKGPPPTWMAAEFWNDGKMYVFNNFGGGNYGSVVLPVDLEWHHYSAVFDGSLVGNSNVLKVYIDGVPQTVTFVGSISSISASPAGNAYISYDQHNNAFFNGKMDEVRIYNRALSATEVTALYGSGVEKIKKGPSDNGLVGYWSFNEGAGTKAFDYSGNGNTGTLTNMSAPATATSGWGNGKLAGGLNFDGTNDLLDLGYMSSLHGSNAVTYSTWLYRTGGVRFDGIISKFDYINSIDMLLAGEIAGVDDIFVRVESGNPGSGYGYTSNNVITPNVWHHVVMVFDGTQPTNETKLKLYVDNVQQTLTFGGTVASVAPAVNSNVFLGYYSSTANHFKGKIDEVRIYNRALSADEVTSLYGAGVKKLNASQNVTGTTLDTGLVGLWSFDGQDMSGNTAYDRSGQGNNGTLTNGPTKVIGKLSQGLSFDGVNDFVDTADINSVDGSSVMTISAWVNESSLVANLGIVTKWDYAAQGNFALQTGLTPGKLTFYTATSLTDNGTGSRTDTTSAVLVANTWQHVAVVFDGSQSGNTNRVKMYVDGVSVAETQGDGTVPSILTSAGTATLKIGKFGGGLTRYFNGSIDEVRIYNRALSADEVKLLYNMGK